MHSRQLKGHCFDTRRSVADPSMVWVGLAIAQLSRRFVVAQIVEPSSVVVVRKLEWAAMRNPFVTDQQVAFGQLRLGQWRSDQWRFGQWRVGQ